MREMKNSMERWIGEIPFSWKVLRGKAILTLLERPVRDDDGIITCFRDGEVTLRSKRREDGFTMSDKEIGYQGIEPGDLVVHGMDGFAGSIGISDSRGKATPVLNVMDSTQNKKYLMYFLRTMAYNGVFLSLSTGIRVRSCDTNWNKLKTIMCLVPPLPEQQRITNFLDRKGADIDNVLLKTKTSIEEYRKLKQSIITEAVTKGVRGTRPMKDSGIEWANSVPSDWEVKRIKWCVDSFSKGNGITKDEVFVDGDMPCIRYGEIYSKYGNSFSECVSATKLDIQSSPQYVTNGNILCAATGELVEEIGKGTVYVGNAPCIAGGDIIIIRHKQNPVFLNYVLNSSYAQAQKSCKKTKLKVVHISASDIGDVLIALPSVEEQQEIALYLDQKCSEIDSLIASKEKFITELESYKKSLIYEYVTGKKEVPAEA